jgi:hypothetical protein
MMPMLNTLLARHIRPWNALRWRARLGMPAVMAALLSLGLVGIEGGRLIRIAPQLAAQTQALQAAQQEAERIRERPQGAALLVPVSRVPAPVPPNALAALSAELQRLAGLVQLEWAHTEYTHAPASAQAPAQLVVTQTGRTTYPIARAYIAMVLNSQPLVALAHAELRRVSVDQVDAEVALKWVIAVQPSR